MNTITQTPSPATATDAGLPLVLLQSKLAPGLRTLAEHGGHARGNRIGLALLAEAIRLTLNAPAEAILPCGEMFAGFIRVECGPLPPKQVIADILALLQRVNLENYFSILLLDLREKYFRPYHQGAHVADMPALTQEQVAAQAAAFLHDMEQRLAVVQKAMGDQPPEQQP